MPNGPLMFDGAKMILRQLVGRGLPLGVTYHLYKAAHTPANTDVLATYTAIEANYTGYASQSAGGWSAPIGSAFPFTILGTSMLFQVGASPSIGNSIYGYYVTDDTNSGALVWAELFSGAPLSMTSAGDAIVLTPEYGQWSEF